VNIGTGPSVTITRRDVAARWPDRKPSKSYTLQTESEEVLTILPEASVELALGLILIRIWILVAEVTEDFCLGLLILYTHDASEDLERYVVQFGEEKLTLWNAGRPIL
jgi:hypothetical protein